MIKMAVDIGNNYTKIGVFDGIDMIFRQSFGNDNKNVVAEIVNKYLPSAVIVSSVVLQMYEVYRTVLDGAVKRVLMMNDDISLPFINNYETPHTLGKDRIAGIVGAQSLFPDQNCLIIDAGTAITYDLLLDGKNYLGGNISPGFDMRLRAMHEFTNALPLVEKDSEATFPGTSTKKAIAAGAINGMIFEVNGYKNWCKQKWEKINFLMTGGDIKHFEKKLTDFLFVEDLVLIGLKRILDYNE